MGEAYWGIGTCSGKNGMALGEHRGRAVGLEHTPAKWGGTGRCNTGVCRPVGTTAALPEPAQQITDAFSDEVAAGDAGVYHVLKIVAMVFACDAQFPVVVQ